MIKVPFCTIPTSAYYYTWLVLFFVVVCICHIPLSYRDLDSNKYILFYMFDLYFIFKSRYYILEIFIFRLVILYYTSKIIPILLTYIILTLVHNYL